MGEMQPRHGVDHPPHPVPRLKWSTTILVHHIWAFVPCSGLNFTFLHWWPLLLYTIRFTRSTARSYFCSGRTHTQPSKQRWFRYSIPLDACRKLHCSWWRTLWTITVKQVLILVQLCSMLIPECTVSHVKSPLDSHVSCIVLGTPRTTMTCVRVFL